MSKALKRALAEAMALVDEADMKGLRGRRGPTKVEIEVEPAGGEDCPECAAGECVKHLSDEDAAGMASMYGEE